MAGSKRCSRLHVRLSSSRSLQYPTASPARNAAPKAVVSRMHGRSTGMSRISLWNFIRKAFETAPPSTRIFCTLNPESLSIAPNISLVWYASDSRVARIKCSLLVPRVNPNTAPLTSLSQYGLPRPTKAGTTYTPSVEATLEA
ncbi:hypothetical protein D3C73_1381050 [compost metagenome]